MEAIRLYVEYKRELRFGLTNGTKEDFIRGAALAFASFFLIGIPTFLGYLVFLLRGQAKNADFLPPIEAEMIGEYTYIGFKYLLFILGYSGIFAAILWGCIQAPISQNIRAVAVIGFICLGCYLFPSTTYLFSATGKPLPTELKYLRELGSALVSYEYMTLVLFTVLGSLIMMLLVVIALLFVVTIPLAFIGLWYLGVTYTRLVGHALREFDFGSTI